MMTILGVDPGLARCGWGIIKAETRDEIRVASYGCIETDTKSSLPQRLKKIYQELTKIIAGDKPSCLAVEEVFFARNVKTALVVSQSRGVILLAAAEKNIPVYEYTPLEVKQALTGYGRAEKREVERMVGLSLNLSKLPQSDDEVDALAIALCHLYSEKIKSRINTNKKFANIRE